MPRFFKTMTATDHASSPGKLNLRLTGFTGHAHLPVDEVVRAIDVLPSFHLEGLREIAYLTEAESRVALMYSAPHVFTRCKGVFVQRERRIKIYGVEHCPLFYQVLYHEIGHYVYYLVISSKIKKQWVTQMHAHSACMTAYASTSASEDFAETYASYILESEGLQAIPEKYAFMHDLVFSGTPETLKEKNR
jgi:hypothetical protein